MTRRSLTSTFARSARPSNNFRAHRNVYSKSMGVTGRLLKMFELK